MSKGLLVLLACACLGTTTAGAAEPKADVFKGKLFAPNVILENNNELGLSKQQFTDIRQAVVEVQAGVAGHEWDIAEAYQNIMDLDRPASGLNSLGRYVDRQHHSLRHAGVQHRLDQLGGVGGGDGEVAATGVLRHGDRRHAEKDTLHGGADCAGKV